MTTSTNYLIGKQGEDAAAELVQELGWQIIQRNYQYFSHGRGRKGEIDIIAFEQHRKILHFIEVKSRRTKAFGSAIEQISVAKIRSLKGAIEYYCLKNKMYVECYKQIDLVTIDGKADSNGNQPVPTIIYNVISFDS